MSLGQHRAVPIGARGQGQTKRRLKRILRRGGKVQPANALSARRFRKME